MIVYTILAARYGIALSDPRYLTDLRRRYVQRLNVSEVPEFALSAADPSGRLPLLKTPDHVMNHSCDFSHSEMDQRD